MKPSRRSGFTLIEIMVVLIIATILASITFGAFRSISEGNKRTTCQSNLSQIYKSARLYAQDYNGKFPYLNAGGAPNQSETPLGGLGLWSLYAFPAARDLCTPTVGDYNTDLNLPLASVDGNEQMAGYVRSPKVFHCPSDRFDNTIQVRTSATTCAAITAPTASLSVKENNVSYLNPSYLSYQTVDDVGVAPLNTSAAPRDTYSSFRPVMNIAPFTPEKRQLIYRDGNSTPERPTDDKTVVTWCRYHRTLNSTGATVEGSRNYDNVLFSDGTVQSLPVQQNVQSTTGASGQCALWKRVPREKADTMADVAYCNPSS